MKTFTNSVAHVYREANSCADKLASVPSNEHASTTGANANSSSVRAKCDPAWDHVIEELKDRKSSCLFETFLLFECNELIYLVLYLKLICYLDVMNLFSICHLDVNVMPNEFIYLVLLKVYYVKDDCFVMLLC